MKPMKRSATMNSAVNESPYGVLEPDRERIMPTMIAMAGKKNIARTRMEAHEWNVYASHFLAEITAVG
jgi:hypothetical protein